MALRHSLTLAAAVLALGAAPASAAPGDFDTSFGGDGIVPYEFSGGYDGAWGVLVEPDGKIVVGGETDLDAAVARIEPDSGLDTSFSLDGLAAFPLPDEEYANAVARQPDGKFVLAGQARAIAGGNANVLVMRTNRDGTLDGSFGTGGIVNLDLGDPNDVAADVLVQPDGKIVLVGRGGAGSDALVARLTAQGQLDPSFSDDGTYLLDLGGVGDHAGDVALAPDGKLVVGADATGLGITVMRLHANGLPDASFGIGGAVPQPPSTGDVTGDLLVQPDGKVVLSGRSPENGFLITRLKTDGSFDESFGDGEALAVVNFDAGDTAYASGLALQANGKIVVAGYTTTGASRLMAMARLQPGGALDTTFSGDGKQNLNGANSFGNDVALQPDGKIVIAGDNGADMLVVRLEGDPVAAGGGPAPGPGGPGGEGGGPGGGPKGGVPRCSGKRATIVGTNRSERLKGTRRADVIVALGGNDKIAAGKGNDVICGGDGNDTVDGGSGNDRLFGQSGRDALGGAAGNDLLQGGAGNDALGGGPGKDSLLGQAGQDRLIGGPGKGDRCTGNAGRDRASCERGSA